MRSIPAIDVPPNFITMRAMVGLRYPLGRVGGALLGSAPWHDASDRCNARSIRAKPRISARWPPTGGTRRARSAMLHKLNPVRLAYIREQVDQHWGCDETSLHAAGGQERARRRLRRGAAGRAAGAAGRGGDRDRRGAGEYRGRAGPCGAGRGWRSTIAPAGSRRSTGAFDLVTCAGSDRACRRPGGVPRRAGRGGWRTAGC